MTMKVPCRYTMFGQEEIDFPIEGYWVTNYNMYLTVRDQRIRKLEIEGDQIFLNQFLSEVVEESRKHRNSKKKLISWP